MTAEERFTTPIGRYVAGDLYTAKTTNMAGQPLIYKSGKNAGQPREEYYFALAIKKGPETDWRQTAWGQIIWGVANKGVNKARVNLPTFSWKVADGDSNIPNAKGTINCEKDGYAGHWILNFTSAAKPTLVNHDGSQHLLDQQKIELGDYIQVNLSVRDNESSDKPGVYLNAYFVALNAPGERIMRIDPSKVGFGGTPPEGAKLAAPVTDAFQMTAASSVSMPLVSAPLPPPLAPVPVPPPVAPTPYPEILRGPEPTQPVLTAKANGATYQQMIAQGWTDQLLKEYGYLA